MNITEHPSVTAYLNELTRLLREAQPEDRAEVVAGVRDHLEAALAEQPEPADADIQEVLSRLGPPEDVAREALGNASQTVNATPWHSRGWVPVTVVVLQFLALLLGLLVGVANMKWTSLSYTSLDVQPAVAFDLFQVLLAAPVTLLAGVLPWLLMLGLVLPSRLWATREKTTHALLLPLSGLVATATPAAAWLLTRDETGMLVGAGAGLAWVIGGVALVLVILTRRALRRMAGHIAPEWPATA